MNPNVFRRGGWLLTSDHKIIHDLHSMLNIAESEMVSSTDSRHNPHGLNKQFEDSKGIMGVGGLRTTVPTTSVNVFKHLLFVAYNIGKCILSVKVYVVRRPPTSMVLDLWSEVSNHPPLLNTFGFIN
jgi:hypothetical protein